jgi:signal transduction histidine kinase
MSRDRLYERYRELQSYVGWTDEDVSRIVAIAPLLEPTLAGLINDFYDEIRRHPDALKVITGGQAQIDRLKGTLVQWIRELLAGRYDAAYVGRRWRVGWRHVDIGLDQVFTNVALSRLRTGLCRSVQDDWRGDPTVLIETLRSLNKLLDLDLAIIEDAYQSEYTARLQQNERLMTLGQVAAGVAHELRNPLNVIKTSVYYLLHARNASPEKKAEHLARIERHVELSDNVISALSSFARVAAPTLREILLQGCVQEALEVSPLGDDIALELDLPPTLPPVLADADQLRIVIANLLRNARDAMPEGGLLTIRGRAAGGATELDVVDTGVGIPPADLNRIMEPLFSTKARGLGLGLAIARMIMDKNQGGIRVESTPGQGSTFTLRLLTATSDRDASP